jgi:hypothetical protein
MATKTVNLRDVPEDLVRQAKAFAALRGMSLKGFILDAVRQAIAQPGSEAASMAFFVEPSHKKAGTRRKKDEQPVKESRRPALTDGG